MLATIAGWAVFVATPAAAAPVLTSAEATVRFTAPTACEVAVTLTIAGASQVEHRLEVVDGASVVLGGVEGASQARSTTDIGRTRALVVLPAADGAPYTIRYQVQQAPSRPGRCPLWLPTVAADGRSRRVRLAVVIPDGATAAGTMPAFAWTGPRGSATLPHLPAIVIVPFAAPGESPPWDVSRLMDLTAMATLVLGTAWWLHRQRKGAR